MNEFNENFNKALENLKKVEEQLNSLKGTVPKELKDQIFSQLSKNSENYEEIKDFIRKL